MSIAKVNDKQHTIELLAPVGNPKKVTATRLGAICGLNPWKTPFGAWCEITRVAEPPFEGNKFTEAGEVIEPKVIAWWKSRSAFVDVLTPQEYFGKSDPGWDFFPKVKILGGKWDAVGVRKGTRDIISIVEVKTSSRPQDWLAEPPAEKVLQALLYGHLAGAPQTVLLAVLLEDKDYDNPKAFEPTDENVLVFTFDTETTLVQGRAISEWVEYALKWYAEHVVGGVSPKWDEKKDKEYLDLIRTTVADASDIMALAQQMSELDNRIKEIREVSGLTRLEKQFDEAKKALRLVTERLMVDGKEIVDVGDWVVKRSYTQTVDKEALEAAGLLEQFTTLQPRVTITRKKEK